MPRRKVSIRYADPRERRLLGAKPKPQPETEAQEAARRKIPKAQVRKERQDKLTKRFRL